jgi:uncharacterized RDD family membrane protein YckC
MKCSKCGYLGFESADRCRNCGYQFSLSDEHDLPDLPELPNVPDLTIRREEEPSDLDDFVLVDAAAAPQVHTSAPAAALQLFAPSVDDDTPLITKPSPPRPPLAVRKSTPEVARLRTTSAPKAATLDLGLDLESIDAPSAPRVVPAERAHTSGPEPMNYEDAGVARRIIAACVDSVILLAIDVVVIYFTMQICGVAVAEFGLLPKGPLVAFLVVQNVGYLVAFTAGGQTLGKMAAGIKVVPEGDEGSLDLGSALKRTVMWLVLAFPAGIGLLSTFFDHDHRGLHDRFAGTRVVRATA